MKPIVGVCVGAALVALSIAAAGNPGPSLTQGRKLPNMPQAGGTVVVGVAVAEGLVLVGDSRMTIQSAQWQPSYKIISDSHNKVMSVGNIGLATFGSDFILGRSTKSWTDDFAADLGKRKCEPGAMTLDTFISDFSKFFEPKFAEEMKRTPNVATGFLIAGYDTNGVGRIKELSFPGARVEERYNTSDRFGMAWEGETDVIQRIVLGMDFSRMATLKHFASMDEPTLKEVRTQLGQLEYNILYQALSLQDAVDLANFLVQATVTMQRFSFGTTGSIGSVPGVGGPVDVLVVTPSELTWISRKQVVAH